MNSLASASWASIDEFRDELTRGASGQLSLTEAAQHFASAFVSRFASIVLARVFVVVPFERLPEKDAEFASGIAARLGVHSVGARTPVLSLLGTRGVSPSWNERGASVGHLAIPLLNKEFVEGAPMIARLLGDLNLKLSELEGGAAVNSRQMAGSSNRRFYVPDAATARDAQDRLIIPSRDFVALHRVKTVFGMGGSYVDGTVVVAIVFTTETLDTLTVDRYPSLISNFKMATTELLLSGRVYPAYGP